MNHLCKLVFLTFFFLLSLQTTCVADDFDIEECSVDSIQFEMVRVQETDGHHYFLSGKCRPNISFTLGSYYWISSPYSVYKEVVKHAALGHSLAVAYCKRSPVLYEKACFTVNKMDPTRTLHLKYGLSMSRRLLTDEQMTELESKVELVFQQNLDNLSRAKTMTMPKPEALTNTPRQIPATPSYTDWAVRGVNFSLQSPEEGQSYSVAPPLKVTLPERVDFQYLVNKCQVPANDTQCEQFERTVSGSLLRCNEQETTCRFEGGFDIPWTANRHYMLFVRPLPLRYDPIIIEFDFPGISKSPEVRKRVKVKE
jgi:hypothetical protein